MHFLSIVSRWFRGPRRATQTRTTTTNAWRPRLDNLEDRLVPATFTVNNTNSSGAGSLRQAIIDANAAAGHDVIRFTSNAAVEPIRLFGQLPTITSPVTMDGSRIFAFGIELPNNNNLPRIELDGSSAGSFVSGLKLGAGSSGSTIRGLSIVGFDHEGIQINASSNNQIQGNFIGVRKDGTEKDNGDTGIRLLGGSSNNLIGGTTAAQRNVISGQFIGVLLLSATNAPNNAGNIIQGNFIGTNLAGTGSIGNNTGVYLATGTVNTVVRDNVLSGNHFSGLVLDGATVTGTQAKNNKIGVQTDGVSPLGNDDFGVLVANGAHDNDIGGPNTGDGNIIGFNVRRGVVVGASPNDGTLGNLAGVGNTVLGNAIFASPVLIDLGPADGLNVNDNLDADSGPNNLQNTAVLASAGPLNGGTFITGSFSGAPATTFQVQFFSSSVLNAGIPQNMSLLSTAVVTSDATGFFSIGALFAQLPSNTGVLVTVTNSATGDTSEFSNVVLVTNNPPMIKNDVLTPDIVEGAFATLSGNLVDPDAGDKLTLLVDWGDGSAVKEYHPGLNAFAFDHRYVDDGVYDVHFTWLDDKGSSNSRTRQVTVHNVAPTITDVDLDVLSRVNHQTKLKAEFADPGKQDDVRVSVDWGDGTTETISLGKSLKLSTNHRYGQTGHYTVTLTVFDDDGGQNTASRQLFVIN